MHSWMRGLGSRIALVLLASGLLAGCGGGKDADTAATVACDDAAFRAQDEELYVVQATISNAIGGGGDPSTLLLDLRRGRTAIADYVEAHPPCDEGLEEIAQREAEAVAAIDDAIAAVDKGSDPAVPLRKALELLESAQRDLGQGP
jgi:hypothetical protein